MTFIDIAGVPHYIQWVCSTPDGPSGSKPIMLFVHGWGGSTRSWEPVAQSLTDFCDCLLYDMRGFGRSHSLPPSSDGIRNPKYAMEAFATDLIELIETLDLNHVIINAHSLGATVGLLAASLTNPRIERLILTCSGIFKYNRLTFTLFHQIGGFVTSYRPRWLQRIPTVDRFFMLRFLHQSIPSHLSRNIFEDYLLAEATTVRATIETAVSLQASQSMPQAFSNLAIPTLLISGEKDQIIPPRLALQAVGLNERIHHVIMPRVGHFPMLEDPDAYLSLVRSFVADPVTA